MAVRYKLFQMNTHYDDTFVNEQLESLLQTFGGETEQSANVRMEEDGSIKALLFDEEMEALGQTCLDDDEWNPVTQVCLIFTLSTFIIINIIEKKNHSTPLCNQ